MADCDCAERLLEQASKLYAEADRLARTKATRPNAETVRRQAAGLGWAAGHLRREQDTHPPPSAA